MRHLVFALALLGATATGAQAQTAIPDLKGTWSGKGKYTLRAKLGAGNLKLRRK